MPSNLQPVRLRLLGFIALSVVGNFLLCASSPQRLSCARGSPPLPEMIEQVRDTVVGIVVSYPRQQVITGQSRSTGAIPPRRYRPVLSRPAVCNRNRICRQ